MNKAAPSSGASAASAQSLVARLLGTADMFRSRMEAALAVADLSLAKVGVLRILADAGAPMALSELAKHNKCVRSNITQLVDRLEKDGLVRRILDPADRRIRRAELTAAGREAQSAGTRILATQEREMMQNLSESDQAALRVAVEACRGAGGPEAMKS